MNRHTCTICKKKRFEAKMLQFGQHWMCRTCIHDNPARTFPEAVDPGSKKIKVLNLYAGVGGNRWLWPASLEITAVEKNPKVAAEYKRNFPQDNLIIGDAHYFLLKNYQKFNIIWSSPPCQSHTKMVYVIENKKYPDLGLYQEILFLASLFKGRYVVENVRPYYQPLVPAQFEICRHLFWTNVPLLNDVILPRFAAQFYGRNKGIIKMKRDDLCAWLGMTAGDEKIYLPGKSSAQVYRNCVHPQLGLSVMNDILRSM